MMDMMNSTGSSSVVFLLWGIHVLSVLAFFAGFVLLIVLAIKTLSPSQMKNWGIGLMVAGAIACLLTIAGIGQPWTGFNNASSGMGGMMGKGMMRGGMMEHMMDRMMGDHDDMSMDDMAESLEGKTGDAFDAAFLEMMIPHHQGAIEMAEMAAENAKHAEIKRMAEDILEAQQREIDQMEQWQKSWQYE